MAYCTKFVCMEEALGMANGSVVDVFAVVASVGPLTPPTAPLIH